MLLTWAKAIFETFMLKHFPELIENTRYLRIPARINKKKCACAYVIVKQQNTQDRRTLKSREG